MNRANLCWNCGNSHCSCAKDMKEPNWEEEWKEILASVTYAGVILRSCWECGDRDRNYCDCAKNVWINEQKKRFKLSGS